MKDEVRCRWASAGPSQTAGIALCVARPRAVRADGMNNMVYVIGAHFSRMCASRGCMCVVLCVCFSSEVCEEDRPREPSGCGELLLLLMKGRLK